MNFRRYYLPNAIVFITQTVYEREPVFAQIEHAERLRSTLRNVKVLHPFSMVGYVILPDHIHLLIQPTGDSTFSSIMHSLKRNYTKNYKAAIGFSGSMTFWQKRFYDHIVRNEEDLQAHLDYIHYNPVKHGLTTRPEDWPYSSFLEWKRRGAYPDQWGWSLPDTLSVLDEDVVE